MNPLFKVFTKPFSPRNKSASRWQRLCCVLLLGLVFSAAGRADTGDVIDDFLAGVTNSPGVEYQS